MTDIVEQLRNAAYVKFRSGYQSRDLAQKAADEIDRIHKEIEELKAALREDAERMKADQDAIDRLRLALSTAHAEGMEEAARIVDHLNGWGSDKGRVGHAEHFASAIRKAKESKT